MVAARLIHAGRLGEARDAISEVMRQHAIGPEEGETGVWLLAHLLELAVLAEDRATAELLAGKLSGLADLYLVYATVVARPLGRAAALLGKTDEAREYYSKALEVAGRIRHRPEAALTHLELAKLLLEHYPGERAEAHEHLDFAIAELRDMKMQPALERAPAVKRKAESAPVRAPAYPDGLTGREVEVLRLIAAGKSNREIAAELVLSIGTVERHIFNIYAKINAHGRAAATTYAIRHQLIDPA